MTERVLQGDCLEVLATLEADSLDACVTDPPYGLRFMGRMWDHGVPSAEVWASVLRVLKPGAHLLAFGGTRTYHRLACAIEDAGFEIRDTLAWMYGQGFPKSLDVSKAIDKLRRRDYVQSALDLGVPLPGRSVDDWTKESHAPGDAWWSAFKAALPQEMWEAIERRVVGIAQSGASGWFVSGEGNVTAPATDAARQWQGWGTALKPAFEPIVLARKPLIGTVAANVLQHGTGALNVEGCRITTMDGCRENAVTQGINTARTSYEHRQARRTFEPASGRWPANVLLGCACEVEHEPGCAVRLLDEQSGEGRSPAPYVQQTQAVGMYGPAVFNDRPSSHHGDSGGASCFFYTAKASRREREGSKHPTVKPLDLMRWLVRLVTPPGGTLLDPFAGTGTTGEAALMEGFSCILIEREAEYVADIEKRLRETQLGLGL